MPSRFSSRRRGFALIEVVLSLACSIGILTLATSFVTNTSTAARVQAEVQRLSDTRQAIDHAYISGRSFVGLNTDLAAASGWTHRGSGDGSHTAWGLLRVDATTLGDTPLDGYEITLTELPADACQALLTQTRGEGWTRIWLDGQAAAPDTLCGHGAHQLTFDVYGGKRPSAA